MAGAGPVAVAADAAVCDDCLRELFDPGDRRFGYPFLNCTNCGPRLTIVTGAPYDRARTTMAGFAMCPECRTEYENPADRRFHAQPTACPVCGPRLSVLDEAGAVLACADPIGFVAAAIREGKIAAMKGLGGYHLVCAAGDAAAVARLRRRKQRDDKPFAVMVGDLAGAGELCIVTEAEGRLLTSRRRPIVLLRRRADAALPEEIAPHNPLLGLMLPYTPLHYLLTRAVDNAPLVMTSGNRSDEPIAIDEADAVARLGGIADLFLAHNRPIHVRCDDSVTRVIGGVETPIRRSRGYAPEALAMPWSMGVPTLAVGGQLKNTFALGSGRRAILSHHLGDLDHYQAFRAFTRDITLYEQLFSLTPACIVHDLHPDYASTVYARQRAAKEGLRAIAVQHHHAHMASCMAEHGLTERVIGVTFDGTGYGTDGAIWGGEFLVGDYRGFDRAAHFRYLPMPGGEQAARHPWRMAAAYLMDAGAACDPFEGRQDIAALRNIRKMIERHFNCPMTSSVGRLFDAIASLIGIRDSVTFEGQAAMQLQWLASHENPDTAYPFTLHNPDPATQIDVRPMIAAVVQDVGTGVPAARIARRFHCTLVEIIAGVCGTLRTTTQLNTVVLSGGVFMNSLLAAQTRLRLDHEGFRVYSHTAVPTNDGGLCLGQLAVAANV